MKRIPPATQKQIDGLLGDLDDKGGVVQAAVDAANKALEEQKTTLTDAIAAYNETASELRELYQGLLDDAENYYGERSEKWQEGEAGQQYEAWKEQLTNAVDAFQDIDEVDGLDEIEMPEIFDQSSWEQPEVSVADLAA